MNKLIGIGSGRVWQSRFARFETEYFMKKLMLALAVAGTAVPVIEAPASAQRYYSNGRTYHGGDRYYNCRRRGGTTGLIIGGAAGALLGRSLDGGRDRTLGTVLGAGAGALLGREVERGRSNRRCYR
jgi:hypothetical protein